jgi:hypothetical protein
MSFQCSILRPEVLSPPHGSAMGCGQIYQGCVAVGAYTCNVLPANSFGGLSHHQ